MLFLSFTRFNLLVTVSSGLLGKVAPDKASI